MRQISFAEWKLQNWEDPTFLQNATGPLLDFCKVSSMNLKGTVKHTHWNVFDSPFFIFWQWLSTSIPQKFCQELLQRPCNFIKGCSEKLWSELCLSKCSKNVQQQTCISCSIAVLLNLNGKLEAAWADWEGQQLLRLWCKWQIWE